MKIDLSTIKDDIDGNWWHHIQSKDFAFIEKIQDQMSHDVEMDDVLIHKKVLEGERFPAIRYHVVTSTGTKAMTNQEMKDLLAGKLVTFVKANSKLPFACKFTKLFKNGAAQVDYTPTQWDNYALKVDPKQHGIDDVQTFLQRESILDNPYQLVPLARGAATSSKLASPAAAKVAKIAAEPVIQAIADGNNGSVCIFNAEVIDAEQHETHFQEEVTIFYMVHVKDGEAAPDTKKSTEHKKFSEIKVRVSDKIMDELKIVPGDKITFNGKLKSDKFFGLMLQNVKKVTK
nr:hypothetical protein [Candidatus Sigynarchaeota archaeon]